MSEEKETTDRSQNPERKKDGRRSRRHRSGRNYQKKDYPVCPYCGNMVKDINTAIASRETGEPVHFDCVLKQIEMSEELEQDEKVCYLGKGSFGIIKTRSGGSMKFFVRKRIQYEGDDQKSDWRKEVSSKIKK